MNNDSTNLNMERNHTLENDIGKDDWWILSKFIKNVASNKDLYPQGLFYSNKEILNALK